jgi:hypothetical protein
MSLGCDDVVIHTRVFSQAFTWWRADRTDDIVHSIWCSLIYIYVKTSPLCLTLFTVDIVWFLLFLRPCAATSSTTWAWSIHAWGWGTPSPLSVITCCLSVSVWVKSKLWWYVLLELLGLAHINILNNSRKSHIHAWRTHPCLASPRHLTVGARPPAWLVCWKGASFCYFALSYFLLLQDL